jgi:HD-GYP domain-containing protein (c-di-GMP phosphodiesterase class II)/DNA-binding CsgD family transcriptional regulator
VGEDCLLALGQMYERWDGRGHPHGLRGAQIALPARVLHLANALEIHLRLQGRAGALAMAAARRGSHFDPDLVDTVLAQGTGAALLAEAENPSVWDAFLAAEPAPPLPPPAAGPRALALAFAQYVDLKSPFTLGHSVGVGHLCRAAAEAAGFDAAAIDTLALAGLLHDLGRVSVPNGLWDKPTPWTEAERDRAQQHSQQTERILRAFAPWRSLADLAAGHHERLDVSGYHRRLPAVALSPAMRLLAAADVFQALTEARAHRAALTPDSAAATLRAEADAGRLDADAVASVLAAAGQGAAGQGAALARPTRALPCGLTPREAEVLQLLARGLSNKQMARALFVSPITIKNHVAHLYEKTGLATRAAAALFAVEHGLV